MKTSAETTTPPTDTSTLHARLVHTITTAVPTCKKVMLIGISGHQLYAYNSFILVDGYVQDYPIYHLAIVVENNTKQALNEVQDVVENKCRPLADVNALVITADAYLRLHKTSQRFASAIAGKAEVLFNNGELEQYTPHITTTDEEPEALTYTERQQLIAGFINGALFYQTEGRFAMAAFLLHQATEHLYICLYHEVTGYRLNTHNLDKLRRYTRCIAPVLHNVFPKNTPTEVQLFNLLQKAYIEGRYSAHYQVLAAELAILVSRVQQLHSLVNTICAKLPGQATACTAA